MQLHVVAGLPRSGSTLLCNLLAQRGDIHVGSTSALPGLMGGISQLLTNSPEVTSDLIADQAMARDRSISVLRRTAEAWYNNHEIVVDKSRGWAQNALVLRAAYPDSAMLVMVRDPREVFASVERQHRRTGEYGPHERIYEKASAMISEQGMIGGPIAWVEDLVRRRLPGVLFIAYNSLSAAPEVTMGRVDAALGLDPHAYDFDDVQNESTDADELYRFKFPHEGSGKVAPSPHGWDDMMDEGLANEIVKRWPFYCQTFGFA